MSVFVLAQVTVKQGQLPKIKEHLRILSESAHSDKEPGTLVYTITQDPADDHKFTLWEEYRDEEAFEFHKNQKPFATFASELPSLLAGPLSLTKLQKAKL